MTPWSTRRIRSWVTEVTRPIAATMITKPASERIIIILRPTRSAKRPQSGPSRPETAGVTAVSSAGPEGHARGLGDAQLDHVERQEGREELEADERDEDDEGQGPDVALPALHRRGRRLPGPARGHVGRPKSEDIRVASCMAAISSSGGRRVKRAAASSTRGQQGEVARGVEEDVGPAQHPVDGPIDVLLPLERLVPGGVAPVGGGPRPARDALDGLHGHVALPADGDDLARRPRGSGRSGP